VKQVTPPSITGKGAGFVQGGSVLDHRFGTSDPYTLGVDAHVRGARSGRVDGTHVGGSHVFGTDQSAPIYRECDPATPGDPAKDLNCTYYEGDGYGDPANPTAGETPWDVDR
jgi:hypothetical protein